jgi:hypothetical protein
MTDHRYTHFTDAERATGERFTLRRSRSTTSLPVLDL